MFNVNPQIYISERNVKISQRIPSSDYIYNVKDKNDLKIDKAKELRAEYMTWNTSYKANVCITKIQKRLIKKEFSINTLMQSETRMIWEEG